MSKFQEFSGTVYLGLIDASNGNFLGYLPPLECSSFVPSRSEPTVLEVKSAKRAMKGQVVYSKSTPGAPSLEMAFSEMDSTLFGLAFAASPAALTVSSGSFTDEVVTLHALDTWYAASKRNLSSVVVKNNAGDVTHVLGTDYEVDTRLGLVRALTGGAITAGLAVKVSASYAAFSGEKFDGELVSQRSFRILFDGRNEVSGKDILVEYHEVPIQAPQEIFDFLSVELLSLTLTGTPITPTGKTSPYTIIRQS
mgnify:CR=1 FL=1